jgi:hypothetical protein
MSHRRIPFKLLLVLLLGLTLWEIWRDVIWPWIAMLLVLVLVFVEFSLSVGTQ